MNNLGTTIGYIKEYFDSDPDMLKIIVALAIPLDLDDAVAWTIIGSIKPEVGNTLLWEIKRLDFVYQNPNGTFYFEREARAELLNLAYTQFDEEFRQKIHKLLLLSYHQKLENFIENSQSSLYFQNCLKIKIGYHLLWLNRPDEAKAIWQSILDSFTDNQSLTLVHAAIAFVTLEHEVLSNLFFQLSKLQDRIKENAK